jgi:hypothetical protein
MVGQLLPNTNECYSKMQLAKCNVFKALNRFFFEPALNRIDHEENITKALFGLDVKV